MLKILEENDKGYLVEIPIIGPMWIDKNKYDYFCMLYEDML
jgi:hypothetical protein